MLPLSMWLKEKDEAFSRLTQFAMNSWVGIGFEDFSPEAGVRPGMRRNGFMLMNKTGIHVEYYKRNLVPCKLTIAISYWRC